MWQKYFKNNLKSIESCKWQTINLWSRLDIYIPSCFTASDRIAIQPTHTHTETRAYKRGDLATEACSVKNQATFLNDAFKIWNVAPINIKNSKTLLSAKSEIRKFSQCNKLTSSGSWYLASSEPSILALHVIWIPTLTSQDRAGPEDRDRTTE